MQFGQPIGAFQSVKHRLADVLVALPCGRRWSPTRAGTGRRAQMRSARGRGGQVPRRACGPARRQNCLQVMGAIGFTEEHVLHRFIARATVLDVLFGSAAACPRRARLGAPRTRHHAAPRSALSNALCVLPKVEPLLALNHPTRPAVRASSAHDVKVDAIYQRVVGNRTCMRGAITQRLSIWFPGSTHVCA